MDRIESRGIAFRKILFLSFLCILPISLNASDQPFSWSMGSISGYVDTSDFRSTDFIAEMSIFKMLYQRTDRKLSASMQAAKIQARVVDDVIAWSILPFDVAYMLIRAGKGTDFPVLSAFCTGELYVRADDGSLSWLSRLGIRVFGHARGMSRFSYSPKISFDAGIDSRLHLFAGVSIDSGALLIAWITNEAEQRRLGN